MDNSFAFQALSQPWWVALVVCAVIAAGVCVVMLMRYERRLVPRNVGATLLTIRGAILVLLLLVCLQPVLSWTISRSQKGRFVVAIDVSQSMLTQDEHGSVGEKLRWARALGMIGNAEINARLDRWIAADREGREFEWVTPDEEPDPERRAELAAIRQEHVAEVVTAMDGISRREMLETLLTKTARPLLDGLRDVVDVDLILFAGEAESVAPEVVVASLAEPSSGLLTQSSDLSSALKRSAADSEGSPLLGVILMTDGRDNSVNDPLAQATRLGLTGIPVYPMQFGSERRPKDLSIASLDYPQTAFKDDKILLRASVNLSGYENQPIDVELLRAGQPPESRRVVAIGSTGTVDFQLDASEVGRKEYILRVPPQEGETRPDNNEKSFAMTVVDDTVRVLLVEGEARWEFRFIDNAFTRDERVDIEKVVFDQPYLGILDETFFPRRLNLPADPADLEHSPFATPDVVILGDISPQQMSGDAFKLIDRFVAESGGTLVIVAGKRSMPLAWRSPELEQLLPVRNLVPVNAAGESGRKAPTERGFHLRLTPEGEGESFLQFDPDPVANRQIWQHLPGFTWGLVGEAKPGATPLAYAFGPDDIPSLNDERAGAVIVHQYYGFGQVLWIGVDSTWRWRHRAGDKYHHRFWGQLGRWAARNKSSAGNEFVRFGPLRTDIAYGEDAVISARWTQPYLRQFPQLSSKAEIYRLGNDDERELFTTIDLTASPQRPLFHEGRAVSLPAGRYRVKLVVQGADPRVSGLEAPLYVQERTTLELSDLSANHELLAQIANSSKGELFYPDQVDQMLKKITDPLRTTSFREEVELWNHWSMMVALFGLLFVEWVLRKLNGLP